MHNIIIQLSTEPISKQEYIGEDNIEGGEMVSIDYAYNIKDEERNTHLYFSLLFLVSML